MTVPARADLPERRGELVVSLEQLVPVLSYTHDRSLVASTTQLTTGNFPGGDTPYNVPRFGLDTLVTRHLTLGAAMSLKISTGSPSNAPGDDPLVSLVALSPRVGFFLPVAKEVGFWPRAGMSFSESFARGYDRGARFTELREDAALTADIGIVAAPIRVLGVVLAIGGAVPIAGHAQRSENGTTASGTATHAALTISGGFLAHF